MGIFSKKSTAVATGAVCASAACAVGIAEAMPESMKLTKVMKDFQWNEVPLAPIDFNVGVQLMGEQNAQDVIKKHTGTHGSIAFVVRRPGWVYCREHGQQLKHLAAKAEKPLDGFDLFGIVKETDVDDAGLEEFHKDYYPYPLYKDLNLKFYEAFGNGSITAFINWNPFKGIAALRRHSKRLKEKKIEGNLVGEGLTTGGLIVFGKDGSPQFMSPEVTGSLINEDDLLAALELVRKGEGKDGEL